MAAEGTRSVTLLDGATRMLAEAKSLEDIRQIRDLAEAARVYARARDLGIEAMNHAAEVKLRAERKGGELLDHSAGTGERATSGGSLRKESTPSTLSDLGITRDQSSDWQAIATIPEPTFEGYIEEAKAEGRPISTAGAVRLARFAPLMSSETPEWYTPRRVVDAVVDALGAIDLDPCAEPARAIPATVHLTETDDGLSCPWDGRVYMNPPYGRTIGTWTGKLRAEYDAGRTSEAIALLPARVETDWFYALDANWMCTIEGRLAFSESETSAPFPSVAVYLGDRGSSFAAAFAALGDVWARAARFER